MDKSKNSGKILKTEEANEETKEIIVKHEKKIAKTTEKDGKASKTEKIGK